MHPRDRRGAPQKWWQEREGFEHANFTHAYGRGGKDDTSANATWEDWERWYAARDEGGGLGKQQELHTNNGVFLAIVVALASIGTIAEINYAAGTGNEILELHNQQTAELGKDVARRRREAIDSGDREERIRKFLIMRDPVEARKYIGPEGSRKLLTPPSSPQRDGSSGIAGEQEPQ
jgi:hypothetical protein